MHRWIGAPLSGWRRNFDEAAAGISLLGKWLAPPWRIYPVGQAELTGDNLQEWSKGGGPVVARLSDDVGLWLDIVLPVGAAPDIRSAAQLALVTASPIPLHEACVAVDLTRVRRISDQLSVPVMVASQSTVTSAAQLVMRHSGRLDAVDIGEAGDDTTPPTMDLRTGALARRSGLTPSATVVYLCAGLIGCGMLGFGAAIWRDASHTPVSTKAMSAETQLLETLLAERRSGFFVIEAVEAASRALPASAYLTELEINGATMRMQGLTTDLSVVAPALESDPALADVRFVGPLREASGNIRSFDLSLTLQGNWKKK